MLYNSYCQFRSCFFFVKKFIFYFLKCGKYNVVWFYLSDCWDLTNHYTG